MVRSELLHYELTIAGLPVSSVDMNGVIFYERELTAEEETTAAAVIAAHDPNGLLPWEIDQKDYSEKRRQAIDLLTTAIQGWDSYTGAQKQTWLGDHMDEVFIILRALIKITT